MVLSIDFPARHVELYPYCLTVYKAENSSTRRFLDLGMGSQIEKSPYRRFLADSFKNNLELRISTCIGKSIHHLLITSCGTSAWKFRSYFYGQGVGLVTVAMWSATVLTRLGSFGMANQPHGKPPRNRFPVRSAKSKHFWPPNWTHVFLTSDNIWPNECVPALQVDDFGFPIMETRLQTLFSRSETLEEARGWAGDKTDRKRMTWEQRTMNKKANLWVGRCFQVLVSNGPTQFSGLCLKMATQLSWTKTPCNDENMPSQSNEQHRWTDKYNPHLPLFQRENVTGLVFCGSRMRFKKKSHKVYCNHDSWDPYKLCFLWCLLKVRSHLRRDSNLRGFLEEMACVFCWDPPISLAQSLWNSIFCMFFII